MLSNTIAAVAWNTHSHPKGRFLRRSRVRRALGLLVALGLLAGCGAGVAGTSSGSGNPPVGAVAATTTTTTTARAVASRSHAVRLDAAPHVAVTVPAVVSAGWTTVARVHGRPAAWIAQRSGATLMRFDQSLVHLTLHAGSSDGGALGWSYGDQITRREIHLVLAAFNGGFKLTYSNVGFMSGGHVAVALKPRLASLVTYTDGTSNIAAWHNGVPSARKTVLSVLQNQRLLVDRGVPAANVSTCVILCWGGTIKDLTVVARSGLGITANGQLVWAAGEQLSPAGLADALIAAGTVRAIELDINPAWVAGYLYVHHRSGPAATAVVPGQRGIAGQLLAPYSRDFIAVVAN
jgi:hypothetical protein